MCPVQNVTYVSGRSQAQVEFSWFWPNGLCRHCVGKQVVEVAMPFFHVSGATLEPGAGYFAGKLGRIIKRLGWER
jgi:hypothetical protein